MLKYPRFNLTHHPWTRAMTREGRGGGGGGEGPLNNLDWHWCSFAALALPHDPRPQVEWPHRILHLSHGIRATVGQFSQVSASLTNLRAMIEGAITTSSSQERPPLLQHVYNTHLRALPPPFPHIKRTAEGYPSAARMSLFGVFSGCSVSGPCCCC